YSPQEADENVEDNRYGWANTMQRHTSDELLDILRKTDRDSGDERFCLAMLLLTESIFLNMYKGNKFPAAHLKRAQDVHQFLNYPWGIDAFKVLLSSIKFNVPSNLLKDKYDIHGYPLALHLWILESIPIKLKQNTVSLEDEEDPELSLLVDLLSKGYKMKAKDWRRGSLDVGVVMEEVATKSYMFYNKEVVKPSSSGESLMEKLDKLYKLVEDEFKSTNQRLSKMEKKLKILSARKRKDQRENDLFFNNPPSPKATEQPAEKADKQTPDQTTEQHTVPLTQTSQTQKTTQTEEITQKISSTNEMSKDEINAENQTQEVTQDINSSEKKNEDNVGNRMNQMDGVDEQQDNDQHDEEPSLQRDTEDGGVNAENPEDSRPTLAQDYSGGLILMEEVEVFTRTNGIREKSKQL
ncbi:predicted protein, partial [Arabidopsis lyrata subsp. lyrata]